MSRGLICDACGEVLEIDSRGDSANGENTAWIRVGTLDGAVHADACTRSCALKLLADDSWLTAEINARYEGVMAVVRAIQEDREQRAESESDDDE